MTAPNAPAPAPTKMPIPALDFCPRLTSKRVTEASGHSVVSRTSVSARSARNVAACPRRAQSGAVTLTREPEANGSWAAIWVEALPKMQMRTKVIEHPEPGRPDSSSTSLTL